MTIYRSDLSEPKTECQIAFEDWASRRDRMSEHLGLSRVTASPIKSNVGEYAEPPTLRAWEAWQAAWDAAINPVKEANP